MIYMNTNIKNINCNLKGQNNMNENEVVEQDQELETEQNSVRINIINKRMVSRYKYHDYKNTLREFLSKNCFTREENIATAENFTKNYAEHLDTKLSVVIDNLKSAGDPVYKELLLNKSFEGAVCTFMLSKKTNDLKVPGNLELICDKESVLKRDFKDISKAIQNIMRIKSSEVLFNGNETIVNNNLAISKAKNSFFIVTL